jgi:hypothetical protein
MSKDEIEKLLPAIEDVHSIFKKYTVGVDYLEQNRRRDIVDYRVFFVKLCLEHTNSSASAIARFIKRDHSTIVHYRNNFDSFTINNTKAYSQFLRAGEEIIDIYPAAATTKRKDKKSAKNRTKKDFEIKLNTVEIHKTYARRFHSMRVKLDYYKGMSIKYKEKFNTLKNKKHEG